MENDYTMRILNYALQKAKFYPLRPIQLWLIDAHFNKANSTMMNIGAFYKFDQSADFEKLAKCLNEIINAYDIFRSRLIFHEGTDDICQRFDGEIFPVEVEKISDADFEKIKKNLRKPYQIINNPLYQFRLFETPTAKYFFMDFYHAMFDGTAIIFIFWNELKARYGGKKISRTPPKYADYILEELRISPEELAEGNNFWREMLKGFDKKIHLLQTDLHGEEKFSKAALDYTLKNIDQKFFKNSSRKENIFFNAATMLTVAKFNGVKNSIISWVYNGRINSHERRLLGIMFEQYPLSWNFEENISVKNFLNGLEEKIALGMKYRRSLKTVYSSGLQDESVTCLFQKRIFGATGEKFSFGDTNYEILEVPQGQNAAADTTFNVNLNETEDKKFFLRLEYNSSRYSANAMKKFAEIFDEIILQMRDEGKMISEILN